MALADDGQHCRWSGASSDAPVAYPEALAFMEERVAAIRAGTAPETVWLLEHPPLYTAGHLGRAGDLLDAGGLPGLRRPAAAASSPITGRASASPT